MKVKKLLPLISIFAVGVLAAICIFIALSENNQAFMPILRPIELTGEYSYDGENWYPYDKNTELSTEHSQVIVKGHLNMDIEENSRWNLYSNHLGISMYCNGELIYRDIRVEVQQIGMDLMKSICGKSWIYFAAPAVSMADEIEIHLSSVHKYNDKSAYDDMLDVIYITHNSDEVLRTILEKDMTFFNIVGGSVMLLSCLLVGAAICSFLMKGIMTDELLKFGILCLLSSGYILFDNMYIFGIDEIMVLRTYGRQLCMMLAALVLDIIMVSKMSGKNRKYGNVLVAISIVVDALILIWCITGTLIYETNIYWVWSQYILCPLMIGCCIMEFLHSKIKWEWSSFVLLQGAILLDLFGVGNTVYYKGVWAKVVFALLCLVYFVQGIRYVFASQRAMVREKKLQAELADLRIATMLSQIKPHFIYNTLGTIEQFCHESPEEAADLVHKFALYLRGNFVELGNAAPITIAQEMEHVMHYVSIEQVRFPDMKITCDLQAKNFLVPALSVQPLVENAIKHGLMRLESGGTVEISTYEVVDGYCIKVRDDGVGFDENAFADGKKHVGIQNIRTRIESMCEGTLTIDSTLGEGTTAIIWIPKEAKR